MKLLFKAMWYAFLHPSEITYFTIVRRYADAKGNFIGELYMGHGREAKMIGMSCDTLPFGVGIEPNVKQPLSFKIDYKTSFLEPMGSNEVRVGSLDPKENATVQTLVGERSLCPVRLAVLNRFIEHILEPKNG